MNLQAPESRIGLKSIDGLIAAAETTTVGLLCFGSRGAATGLALDMDGFGVGDTGIAVSTLTEEGCSFLADVVNLAWWSKSWRCECGLVVALNRER